MPSSIGIRVYLITVTRKRARESLSFESSEFSRPVGSYISAFVQDHREPVEHEGRERSWYFELVRDDNKGSVSGQVQYGTFGFESNLKNKRTKRQNYRRLVDDVEEIPLFYEFWSPKDAGFGLVAFQSFHGRSCISLVMADLQSVFERDYPGYTLRFKKLMPSDVNGSLYYSQPVKRLRLIKRNATSDEFARYFRGVEAEYADFEVAVTARRNGRVGNLGQIKRSMPRNAAGVVMMDGIGFNEAQAEIVVGGKTRRVGVFGSDSEAGVIDLTDIVHRGADGHPTFESIANETESILKDFYATIRDK